jgi:hypothetical protein
MLDATLVRIADEQLSACKSLGLLRAGRGQPMVIYLPSGDQIVVELSYL